MQGKISELSVKVADMEHQQHDYIRHQRMVEIMRAELMRYKKAVEVAHKEGVLINAFGASARLDQKALDRNRELTELVDLERFNEGWCLRAALCVVL